MRSLAVSLVVMAALHMPAAAQQTAAFDSATWSAWRTHLAGSWDCAGAFANGWEHAATIRFSAQLDERWGRRWPALPRG
jgi:hypothetical protein